MQTSRSVLMFFQHFKDVIFLSSEFHHIRWKVSCLLYFYSFEHQVYYFSLRMLLRVFSLSFGFWIFILNLSRLRIAEHLKDRGWRCFTCYFLSKYCWSPFRTLFFQDDIYLLISPFRSISYVSYFMPIRLFAFLCFKLDIFYSLGLSLLIISSNGL